MIAFVGLFCLFLPVSCTSTPTDDIRFANQLPESIDFHGFSIPRPKNSEWYVRKDEISSRSVTFRQEFKSKTHTFYAKTELVDLPKGITTIEDLKAYLEREYHSSQRMKVTSKEFKIIEDNGRKAVVFIVESDDNDTKLKMYIRGFAGINPFHKETYLASEYSERGLESEIKDPQVRGTADAYMSSIEVNNAKY